MKTFQHFHHLNEAKLRDREAFYTALYVEILKQVGNRWFRVNEVDWKANQKLVRMYRDMYPGGWRKSENPVSYGPPNRRQGEAGEHDFYDFHNRLVRQLTALQRMGLLEIKREGTKYFFKAVPPYDKPDAIAELI